jgi:predicted acyl esterase
VDVPVIANIPLESDFRAIYWNSDALPNGMKIRGTPSVSLRIQPHYHKVQLVAYLYDMDAWGYGKLITHGVVTLPDANWGSKVRVDFDMVTTAYDVPAGHKVVVAIDTKDPYYKSPTTADFYVDFQYKTSEQNVVTIPTL